VNGFDRYCHKLLLIISVPNTQQIFDYQAKSSKTSSSVYIYYTKSRSFVNFLPSDVNNINDRPADSGQYLASD